MTTRHGWRAASTVGLVILTLAGPGWAQGIAARHSGTVAAVDRPAGTITIEIIGPWRVRDGETVITRLTVKPVASTAWLRARRAAGAGPRGWEGEFIEVPQGAWEIRPGEYVTVELEQKANQQVVTRVTVSEPGIR